MECELIDWLRARYRDHPNVVLGPGDDAALLKGFGDDQVVVATDLLCDGIHFQTDRHDLSLIGRKALAVNLSDLAAMGAAPTAAFVSLLLPRDIQDGCAQTLMEGLLQLADAHDMPVAGGDTNSWEGKLVINVTVVGRAANGKALTRSGARPGDLIIVTGDFGGSIAGKHLRFTPRVREVQQLMSSYELHAAIDVSDGLSLDLSRLARESGCGAAVDLAAVPISIAARELSVKSDSPNPIERALGDGEDFELILAVPAPEANRLLDDQPLSIPLTQIGSFVSEPGLWRVHPGEFLPLEVRGYEHRF